MFRMSRRAFVRAVTLLVAASVLGLTAALPVAAHVTVSSPDASAGGFGKLVVRVPTESDTASTTKIEIKLPADTPFARVSSKPHAGWTVTTTERKLAKPVESGGFTLSKAVATVTWTAGKGGGIKPGQFDEFELSVGPFPKGATTLSLPATQTYSDGTVVKWLDVRKAGAKEPEHAAPTLAVVPAKSISGVATQAVAATTATKATSPAAGSDAAARWLGGVAVVLAAAALAVALLGARRRKT
ncbi:MAG: hypothetical protein QOE19_1766 [Actinomycetota bacterium]|nr:hypothetical protein [Actinomycetota bacterium]